MHEEFRCLLDDHGTAARIVIIFEPLQAIIFPRLLVVGISFANELIYS